MRQTEQYTEVESRPHGNRAHARRKLAPMAYIELGQENGGILLNLSEGGFAVQSALALTAREFSELRFQVPAVQGWLTASGRVVWMSESKKEAGVQFTELSAEARREILKWVLGEGESREESNSRAPGESIGGREPEKRLNGVQPPRLTPELPREPSKEVFEKPRPAAARTVQPPTIAAREVQQRPSLPVAEKRPEREPATVTVAEPTQDFRFTDYSMFAAEAERGGSWGEPVRKRRNWGAGAIVGVLVAALFFALGATMGRGGVDRLIAYFDGSSQVGTTPKVAPPNPPEQSGSGEPEYKKPNDSGQGASAGSTDSGRAMGEESSGAATSPENGKSIAKQSEAQEAANPNTESDGKGGAETTPVPSVVAPNARERRTSRGLEGVARNNPQGEGDLGRNSILVNAPEPGSRPFYVSLPGEAISASAAVATSARRTIEILPRRAGEAGRSERVTIGKLVAHSDPFYPAEARNRHIEGSVELRVRVGRTGEVIGVTPVSGPGLLVTAAATAVREWRYEPTFIDGDPTETMADIFMVFRLP